MLRHRIIAFVTMWLICQSLTGNSVLFFNIENKELNLLYWFRSFERKSPLFIFLNQPSKLNHIGESSRFAQWRPRLFSFNYFIWYY